MMEGEGESHWRGFDCDSDFELDILVDKSASETDTPCRPDSPAEPWKNLARAKESSLSPK